ncbi:MAG: thermonuclease family protein [Pseudomonadota bacterium]
MDQLIGYIMDLIRTFVVLLLSFSFPADYTAWEGRVTEIVRPEEIKVASQNRTFNVRLYGVDTPLLDSGQLYGKTAALHVSRTVLGKTVLVRPLPGRIDGPWYRPKLHSRDVYGRVIGLVYLDGELLSKRLLVDGAAWWDRRYVPFERGFKHLEDVARQSTAGLWADPTPVPPWVFQGTRVAAPEVKEGRRQVGGGDDKAPGSPEFVPGKHRIGARVPSGDMTSGTEAPQPAEPAEKKPSASLGPARPHKILGRPGMLREQLGIAEGTFLRSLRNPNQVFKHLSTPGHGAGDPDSTAATSDPPAGTPPRR